MLKCPRDGEPLREETYAENLQVDVCPTCQGMWLNRGELTRLRESFGVADAGVMRDVPADSTGNGRPQVAHDLISPAAGCPLVPKEYGLCPGLVVYACPKSGGVWIDGPTVTALEEFFATARDEVESRRNGFWASLTGIYPLYRLGRVTARFLRKADGQPLAGTSSRYVVRLFDKDPVTDDLIAEPRLDAEGRVSCTFDLYDVATADSPLERKPDLYLVVYEGDREIYRTPVIPDLDFTPTTEGEVVSHDLGTYEV
jgi:Zn-finger nucleic acid-binding protein